ncbi:DUF2627 domain-containing protein [Xylanibacillus composti]|uniref:DUF2627 domain-containing protein n=1 Tax=Xylanibacillus composti TaxID=1572762 RepID=UPI001BD15C1B|nr:DUF2627 domain-containing protein [Xylanibacillus composti]MDT9726648.1 DUF2627 domain-containing protein [Xylanibacillus composti]
MNQVFARLIAVLLLVIPGLAATFGFLEMKNAIFAYAASFGEDQGAAGFGWGQFMLGLLLFAAGVGFIGGWIFFRDRKRNYVAPRFKAKRK